MAFGSMNSGDDSPMADINVTPLVDVMLVLLIVFMITMPVMTHSIPLELPTASAKQVAENAAQPKDPLRISISADGSYHLAEGEPITLQALESQLQQLAKTNPDQVIAIAADKNAHSHASLSLLLKALVFLFAIRPLLMMPPFVPEPKLSLMFGFSTSLAFGEFNASSIEKCCTSSRALKFKAKAQTPAKTNDFFIFFSLFQICFQRHRSRHISDYALKFILAV